MLKDLLTDVNVVFDEHGMRMLAMDGARVALVHVKLNGTDIEQYECSQRYTLGVNLASLYKLLKGIGNNDTVCFKILDSALDELILTLENADKNQRTEWVARPLLPPAHRLTPHGAPPSLSQVQTEALGHRRGAPPDPRRAV